MRKQAYLLAWAVMACALTACSESSQFSLQDTIAESQRAKAQRDKDLKVTTSAFDAYIQAHAQFEQQLIALDVCGEEAFINEHATEAGGVYWWFMTQRVDQALKDRAPIRDKSKETPEETTLLDDLEESSILSATNFLERELYYTYLQHAYRQGLFSAYTSMGDAVRVGLCSGVERYKADVVATIAKSKPKPPI